MLVFVEEANRKTWIKTLRARREPTTNSIHIWHWAGIDRQPHYPCSLFRASKTFTLGKCHCNVCSVCNVFPTVCQSRSPSFPHGFCQDLIIQKIVMTIKMKYMYQIYQRTLGQPPPCSMPSKLLILQGEAKSYCFAVGSVPESMFNYL